MKRVVKEQELATKMQEAISLLCDTVKMTLGPKGANAIIDHSAFSPFITNDGVTIAANMASDDPIVNTILVLARESAIKTNEVVGDGTTTTLVLLETLYNQGVEALAEGMNPIQLKKQYSVVTNEVIAHLKDMAHKPSMRELQAIATTSANSLAIGRMVAQAFAMVHRKEAIIITESDESEDKIIPKEGYVIESRLASPYFLLEKQSVSLDNPYILLFDGYLHDFVVLAPIINILIKEKRSLIMMAHDYDDDIVNQLLDLNRHQNILIYPLIIPGYGITKYDIMYDVALISEATIWKEDEPFALENLGIIKHVVLDNSEGLLTFEKNEQWSKKMQSLKHKYLNMELNEEVQKRMAMLDNGLVEIKVGGLTKLERREKKMRFDDALAAIGAAEKGILPGGGVTFYQIADKIANPIFQTALKAPLKQILTNAGVLEEAVINTISQSHYTKLYNVKSDKYEDITDTLILDSLDVLVNAISNASSIASMLLTTKALIINEFGDNPPKLNANEEI